MDGKNEPNLGELKKLAAALRGLEKDRVFVPGDVDTRVLEEIQKHFGQEKAASGPDAEAREDARALQATHESHATIAAAGVEDGKLIEAGEVLFRSKRAEVKARRPKRWQNWMPLAAAIAIAAVMIQFARMGRTVAGDVNADGTADVVDALVLAEQVRRGETERRWDVNGDRVVDARDSEEIMARAVDLKRSGL